VAPLCAADTVNGARQQSNALNAQNGVWIYHCKLYLFNQYSIIAIVSIDFPLTQIEETKQELPRFISKMTIEMEVLVAMVDSLD